MLGDRESPCSAIRVDDVGWSCHARNGQIATIVHRQQHLKYKILEGAIRGVFEEVVARVDTC